MLKIAREGSHMTVQHLIDFEDKRRYATLVALVIESTATITDEIIDLHDRIIEKLFSTAKNTHQKQFQPSTIKCCSTAKLVKPYSMPNKIKLIHLPRLNQLFHGKISQITR